MPTTAQMLSEYPDEMLEVIAEQRSASPEGSNRIKLIEALAAELTDPTSVRFACEDAADENRLVQDAVEALLKAGGEMAEAKFSKEFGSIRQMGPARMRRETPWLNPESVAEVLYYLGLIGRTFRGAGQHAHTVIYLPSDVSPWLPRAQAEAPVDGLPVLPVPPPPRTRTANTDDSLLDDVGTLLGFLISEPLRLEATGPNPQDIDKLVQRLQLPFDAELPEQEIRLALLLHLANRLGFLRRGEGGVVALSNNRVREFLEKTRAEQRQALFHGWHSSQEWNDLCRTPGLECDMATSAARNDPLQTRANILHHLSRLQPGQWYSISSVVAALREAEPNFQRPTGRYDEWNIRRAGDGESLAGIEHWDDVDGALVRFLIRGPLHWLGATDLAEPAAGDDWLMSLTAWGSRWLGLDVVQPTETPPRPLQVREDFSIVIPLGAPLYDRFRVERFAQWQSSYPQYVYQINQRSLKRATDNGLPAAKILAFLSSRSTRIPERVTAALQRVQTTDPSANTPSAPPRSPSEAGTAPPSERNRPAAP